MKDRTLKRVKPVHWISHPWVAPVVLMSILGQTEGAIAHGVEMQYRTTQAISVQAKYDTGSPLANAQITVYAPDSDSPWLKGTTDDQGTFTFTPDPSKTGTWQVKARLAGHGDVVNIPVGGAGSQNTSAQPPAGAAAGYTPLQKGVMAASVIWGAIGTALFFLGRKR